MSPIKRRLREKKECDKDGRRDTITLATARLLAKTRLLALKSWSFKQIQHNKIRKVPDNFVKNYKIVWYFVATQT